MLLEPKNKNLLKNRGQSDSDYGIEAGSMVSDLSRKAAVKAQRNSIAVGDAWRMLIYPDRSLIVVSLSIVLSERWGN